MIKINLKKLKIDLLTKNNETVEIAVRWLKISREPWPDVLKNWEITYDFRQQMLVDNKTGKGALLPVSDYYEQWEVLSLPQGYTLLELDFRKKYPEKESVLVFAWERYMPFLEELMKAEIKDIYGKKLLKRLSDGKLSLESASALTLFLLPHMIPPKEKIKYNSGEKVKANVTEARNAFILQTSVPGDLIPAIQRRQKVALKLNKRVQPFVAVAGDSIEKFNMCYVVIDNIKYRFDNIVKAFDVCFKAIHSLNTEYSYEATGAWLFVQQALYGISTRYDRKNFAVAALVKSFQALCNTSTS